MLIFLNYICYFLKYLNLRQTNSATPNNWIKKAQIWLDTKHKKANEDASKVANSLDKMMAQIFAGKETISQFQPLFQEFLELRYTLRELTNQLANIDREVNAESKQMQRQVNMGKPGQGRSARGNQNWRKSGIRTQSSSHSSYKSSSSGNSGSR